MIYTICVGAYLVHMAGFSQQQNFFSAGCLFENFDPFGIGPFPLLSDMIFAYP